MQKKNRIKHTKLLCFVIVLLAACFLCSCTKKEDLLILSEDSMQKAANEAADGFSTEVEQDYVNQEQALDDGAKLVIPTAEEAAAVKGGETESGLLYVHVCGAVEMPGVYELPAGSRVYEAVQAAGGFSAEAEQDYVNQARVLTDGAKLVIPTVEEAAAGQKSGAVLQIGIVGGDISEEDAAGRVDTGAAKRTDGRININTATKQELCTIPGVGETRAAAIISYRESHGGFTKPEDIMKVNGIKEGMYEKIKDSISVN